MEGITIKVPVRDHVIHNNDSANTDDRDNNGNGESKDNYTNNNANIKDGLEKVKKIFASRRRLNIPHLPTSGINMTSSKSSSPFIAQTSLLAPPSPGPILERCGSSSSLDSSISQQSGSGRRRRRSSSRLSDLDDIARNDVTLMSFARKVKNMIKRCRSSTTLLLGRIVKKTRRYPILVCEAEVMDETDKICRDYIVHKMSSRDLMSRSVTIVGSDWHRSPHVIAAGTLLEYSYPKTFCNVSRKLCMTMSSPKAVRTALASLLDVMFEGGITWGKMVAMMSIASLFAEECASQGHPDFVSDVVDTVMDLTSVALLEWLVMQGGWPTMLAAVLLGNQKKIALFDFCYNSCI